MFSISKTCGRLLGVGLVTLGIGLTGAATSTPAASALPCQTCVGPPPPPPPPPPVPRPWLNIDLARQTPDRQSVSVVGWTDQTNIPSTPITVEISVDGGAPSAFTANVSRPDVAAAHPTWGPNHGFNVTLPAGAATHQVCVTAIGRNGGGNTTACTSPDDVVGFAATGIQYNTSNMQILSNALDELDTEKMTNNTTVTQGETISGQKTLTDTSSWTDTYGIQVTVSGQIGIPIISNFTVSVQGSASFAQNGSTSEADTFIWLVPIVAPPDSIVEADVAVYRTTLVVPYTMSGNAVYASGFTTPYSIGGTYTGVDSHDLQSTVTQSSLDGTPASAPARQPAAKLAESRTS